MIRPFEPFPRYENAIFVGDRAAEALGALRIYARALIGGEIPNMELLHPTEKPLECVACAMGEKRGVLTAAARKIRADYVLLEDNGEPELNPVALRGMLEAEGIPVRVLDVRGDACEVIARAGELFGMEHEASRVIDNYTERMNALRALGALPPFRVAVLLGFRHPVRFEETYVFSVTARSDLARDVISPLGGEIADTREDRWMPGIADAGDPAELLALKPDAVVACGDAAAVQKWLYKAGVPTMPVLSLPYYCRALEPRFPFIATVWRDVISAVAV